MPGSIPVHMARHSSTQGSKTEWYQRSIVGSGCPCHLILIPSACPPPGAPGTMSVTGVSFDLAWGRALLNGVTRMENPWTPTQAVVRDPGVRFREALRMSF